MLKPVVSYFTFRLWQFKCRVSHWICYIFKDRGGPCSSTKVKLKEAHLHRGGITPCGVNYSLKRALVLKQFQITQFQLLYVTTTAVSVSSSYCIVVFMQSQGRIQDFFFRRGCTRLLLYFNINKPHTFFLQNTSCIRNRRSSQGEGGVRTPCTLPLDPPLKARPDFDFMSAVCWLLAFKSDVSAGKEIFLGEGSWLRDKNHWNESLKSY